MKKRRKLRLLVVAVLFIFLLLAFSPVAAFAEDSDNGSGLAESIDELLGKLDLEELEQYLKTLTDEEKDFFGKSSITDKISSIVSGDFRMDYDSFLAAIGGLVFGGVKDMLPVFAVICAIAILCGLLHMFQSSFMSAGTSKLIYFVGYAAILVLILTSMIEVVGDCYGAVRSMQKQMQAVFPILLTLIATSGGSVSVAVYQPAVVFLSEIIVNIISTVVLPVAVMLVVICMVGNMSEEIKLNNFAALFKSINKWVLGISLTAFTVFLTVQGITSATYDGLSFKAAKYAISNSVPIIGGFLSGGFDLMIAGSVLIKNALGSCSLLLLVSAILVPFVQLVVFSLFLKLTAAVTEPVGDGKISGFLTSLSGTVNYFIAGILAVAFMYFITLLLLICSSNTLF